MGNVAIYKALSLLFQGLNLVLFIRIILSWIPHSPNHGLIRIIYQITDPLLKPFQNLIPTGRLGIDLSPIFAFLAIGLARDVIFRILF